MKTWISNSPSDTWKIASELFQTLELPAVIALHGNLGSGKTCFTQGLAVAAGIKEPVCSPTYTLICEYAGTVPFYHMDLYRLGSPEEAYDLGLDEYLEMNGISVIEWAERAAELLPPKTLHIRIERGEGEEQRRIAVVESPL
ncbi:MAG: tRNA (adenosine(37)-N6)-threonylcarbamoyltransferase complex ATPase subunit type 1 TsaE [Kiritimatiellaceae bacterium]|nr:tRNA (adenosine(37)-N6)-threonylcarbamoyltransferase complex ATPase subunit type 1 TsaE [Kiritimatiellaceae bacterium]